MSKIVRLSNENTFEICASILANADHIPHVRYYIRVPMVDQDRRTSPSTTFSMATSAGRNSSSAQSFECAICLERLRVPKALPCLHTFCLTCLQRHIKSTVTSKAAKNIRFLCPECRVECSPPNPKKPVEEWAAQFPSNFHLQRLIDAESAEASNEMQRGQQNIPGADFARRLKDFRSFVDNALFKLGAVQQRLTTERARVANTYDQSKDRLKEVFTDMMSVMKASENELEGRLEKDYLKYMQQMIHQEESVETKMKHLRQYSDNITNVMTTGRQSESSLGFDMADTMRQLDREHRDMTNDVNFTCQQPCQSLVISPGEVATILSSITKLGTFTSDTRAPSDSRKDDQPPPLPPRPPHAQRQVSSSRSQTQTQLRTAPSSHEYRPQMSVPSATQTGQRGPPSALADQLECYDLNSEGGHERTVRDWRVFRSRASPANRRQQPFSEGLLLAPRRNMQQTG